MTRLLFLPLDIIVDCFFFWEGGRFGCVVEGFVVDAVVVDGVVVALPTVAVDVVAVVPFCCVVA